MTEDTRILYSGNGGGYFNGIVNSDIVQQQQQQQQLCCTSSSVRSSKSLETAQAVAAAARRRRLVLPHTKRHVVQLLRINVDYHYNADITRMRLLLDSVRRRNHDDHQHQHDVVHTLELITKTHRMHDDWAKLVAKTIIIEEDNNHDNDDDNENDNYDPTRVTSDSSTTASAFSFSSSSSSSSSSLRVLTLRNGLRREGCMTILNSLPLNHSLRVLDLSGNKFWHDTCIVLCNVLPKLTTLRSLSFDLWLHYYNQNNTNNNNIVQRLVNSFQQNYSLISVNINGYGIAANDDSLQQTVNMFCKRNRYIAFVTNNDHDIHELEENSNNNDHDIKVDRKNNNISGDGDGDDLCMLDDRALYSGSSSSKVVPSSLWPIVLGGGGGGGDNDNENGQQQPDVDVLFLALRHRNAEIIPTKWR